MPIYIHQRADWPAWRWDHEALAPTLSDIRHRQGRLLGRMESLGFELRQQATLRTLTDDAVKTSEIEGERLDTEQVRSSVARRLGIALERFAPQDRHVDGLVEVLLDATQSFAQPLTCERLWGWHAALFPTGYNGLKRIVVGGWRGAREDPMQVVSGALGRERVHFEAPTADRLDREMGVFLDWFNAPGTAATAGSPAPSPTSRWPGRKARRNASTACPLRSGWTGAATTSNWSARRRARSTSRRGWRGSWRASGARWRRRRLSWR